MGGCDLARREREREIVEEREGTIIGKRNAKTIERGRLGGGVARYGGRRIWQKGKIRTREG